MYISPKKIYKPSIRARKDAQHLSQQGNKNQNHNEYYFTPTKMATIFKIQTEITSADKDMEKLKPSHRTVGM